MTGIDKRRLIFWILCKLAVLLALLSLGVQVPRNIYQGF